MNLTLQQYMRTFRRMNRLSKLRAQFGWLIPKIIAPIDWDPEFDRWVCRLPAIVSSMTSLERDFPGRIDRSRACRIARGSGVAITDVEALISGFLYIQKILVEWERRSPRND